MGIANADQTRLKEDLSKVQQSEWSDQQKADYITDLLREYSDEYELPYLSVMNRPEIRELLEQNEGVAQQVLAELGRLQIEQDIAQRMEARSGLSYAESVAQWVDIDGKTYLYMMPYYGEIPGYTYMEVRRGAYPSGADGYAYTTDYVPNSEVSRYKLTNKLIVANEVVPPIVNFVYFSVYLASIQEQYGQGQAAKTTPKPGDPDFMGPTEGSGKRNIIDNMDEIADDIVNINKKYSDGYEMNNSVENILNSASYYDDPYEKVAAVTRSVTDHAFANGNKRTAMDTMNMLLDDFGLNNSLTDAQKWDLIYDIAEGRLGDVTEIANILKGN